MDDSKTLFISMLQKKAINKLETGIITKYMDQKDFIEDILLQLVSLKDKKVTESVQRYWKDQQELEKQMDEKGKEQEKLMETYTNNIKEIYEMIKKL